MADFIEHTACEACGSSDAKALYADGTSWCFSCSSYDRVGGSIRTATTTDGDWTPMGGDYEDLPSRKLYATTLKMFGYKVGQGYHAAPIYDRDNKNKLVAQKVRKPGKEFTLLGSLDRGGLFGQNIWPAGGKRLVITEGEIDAMSYSQAAGNTWPVVSVPNGAQGAAKAIQRSLEYIESFDEVVFLFDNDEPGENAARQCAELIKPGIVKIAKLPMKDASDMLVKGMVKELKVAVYSATAFRPDGIVSGADLDLAFLKTVTPKGLSIPYAELNDAIRGLRKRELVMVCAGSGIGKSTLVREMGYHLTVEHGCTVGYIMLEESLAKTAQALVAIDRGIPVGELMEAPSLLTDAEWEESFKRVVAPSYMYDAWGSSDVENIISKMRYLAVGCGCDFIILDHISMVVSGLDVDERKTLDMLMTAIRAEVVEATGVGVLGVVHLKRNSNKESFNEGGQVSITDLRGSAAIEQLSDVVIAAERNQQDEKRPTLTTLRLLKNRPFGVVGKRGYAEYIIDSGRLLPAEAPTTNTEKEEDFPF